MRRSHKNDGSLKLIWSFNKGSKVFFVISIVSAFLNTFMEMLSPQIIRMTVDNIIDGKEPTYSAWIIKIVNVLGGFEHIKRNIWIASAALIVVDLIKVIALYLFRVYNTKGCETLVKNMRDTLFGHIERLPFSWHMKNKTGDIIQRCTSDIDTMRSFVSEQMTGIIRIIVMLLMSIVFMLAMNPMLTIIAMIPMPVLIMHSLLFHNTVYYEFEKCDENEGKLSAMVQENLTGVRVVRAFGKEKPELDKFEKQNEYYTSLWVKVGRSLSRFWSISDLIANMQILLLVVAGALLCYKDIILIGEYIAFISYNARLIWPVRQLGRMISELSKATVSVQRIKYILDSEVESDPHDASEPDMNGDIVFDNVSFRFENCDELLHNVSFTIESGTTLGIIGGTGSGKSTLMFLLDKLYDLPEGNGSITVGGVDIRKITTSHLRSNIGMVLQEPFLFSRTISENIGITDEKLTLTDIREAAKDACLDDSVTAFTKGYDTMVGERGVTLSGGQKQRAAIARMLTQKTPIMILDDSLSAVDTQTDAKIRQALEKHFGGATVIIISHRITTLSHCDKIIVLEKGSVAEMGTHDQLKDAGGVYSLIYQSQTGLGEEAI